MVLLAIASLLLGAAAPVRSRPAGAPVPLQSHPGTPADATARKLVADDLAASASRGDKPLVLIGEASLGGAQPALFVQLQSAQECGSAGCATSVYSWEHGSWRRVLDSAAGTLAVSPKKTHARNDLVSDNDHFVWTGTQYQSTKPAPKVNLLPQPRRR